MKKLATVAALSLVALAWVLGSRGATAENGSESRLPDVVVEAVTPEASSGARHAGDTVRGVATVSNPTAYPAKAQFETGVVGGFDQYGAPSKVYAMDYDGKPFSLAPGERAEVPFAVTIPAGLAAKDVAVQVQARLVGSVYVGWGYSDHFSVAGSGGAATVESAYFTLSGGEEVAHTAGPTLYPDAPNDKLPLSVVLRGQGVTLSLTPVVTVQNRGDGAPTTRRLGEVRVPANGVATAVIPFTHAGQAPGVYEGKVSWVDAAGASRAPDLGFRYVVAGQTATVHAVSASAAAVAAGQDFTVTVSLSGAPIDLAAADRSLVKRPAPARVSVTIADASGAEVASASRVETLPALGEMSFGLTASRAADSMVAKVAIFNEGGEEIFSRSYPLLAGEVSSPSSTPLPVRSIFYVAAALAAALLATSLAARRRFRYKTSAVATLAAAAVWALACYASTLASGGNVIITQDDLNPGWLGCTGPNIYVNRPLPGAQQACNVPMLAQARVQYSYCSNSSNYGSSQMWFTKNGLTLVSGAVVSNSHEAADGDHSPAYYDGILSLPIPAALLSANGNYGVWVTNSATIFVDGCSWTVTGVRHFAVASCDQCLNIAGAQATVPVGMERDAAGNCALPDVCANIAGVQSSVPTGMLKDVGGNCTCVTGSTWNEAAGRCDVGDHPPSTGCPSGTKLCNGACVSDSFDCAAAGGDPAATCPVSTQSQQYCVEIFNGSGARTDQFPGLSLEDLESVFGLGLRLQYTENQDAGQSKPIFGVIGRFTSTAGPDEASVGCAGVVCAPDVRGCLTTVDPVTGGSSGSCSQVGTGNVSPQVNMQVEPAVVGKGGSCRVYWSSHGMNSCQVTGPSFSSGALAGATSTQALDESVTYSIRCADGDGKTYSDAGTCAVSPGVREF